MPSKTQSQQSRAAAASQRVNHFDSRMRIVGRDKVRRVIRLVCLAVTAGLVVGCSLFGAGAALADPPPGPPTDASVPPIASAPPSDPSESQNTGTTTTPPPTYDPGPPQQQQTGQQTGQPPTGTGQEQTPPKGDSTPGPPKGLPVMSNLALSNRRGVLTVNFPCSASGSASARIRVGSQVWRSAPKAYVCKSLRGAPTFRLPATLTKTLRHHRAAASASLIISAAHKTRTLSLALDGAGARQIRTNLDTVHFWDTGNADCNDFVYYDTPYIEVTPPAVNEFRPPEGGSMWFYWRSGLITWDGIHNKWLPNRAGDNGSGGNWNWAQYSSFELDVDLLVTSSGHQYYTMASGQGLYTYAWVQTYYWINGTWYGGRSKWMQNHAYHPLVGGYCYWG